MATNTVVITAWWPPICSSHYNTRMRIIRRVLSAARIGKKCMVLAFLQGHGKKNNKPAGKHAMVEPANSVHLKFKLLKFETSSTELLIYYIWYVSRRSYDYIFSRRACATAVFFSRFCFSVRRVANSSDLSCLPGKVLISCLIYGCNGVILWKLHTFLRWLLR